MQWILAAVNRQWMEHVARTTVAATLSLLAARAVGLPEAYWAAITTMIVMQSTLGAAWTISLQRLAGTVLGAATGALLATYFGTSAIAFGAGILALGLICAILHLDRTAYRFSGITLAVIMLVASNNPVRAAMHRFFEVSLGIVGGLLITAVWPERLDHS